MNQTKLDLQPESELLSRLLNFKLQVNMDCAKAMVGKGVLDLTFMVPRLIIVF